MFEITWFFCSHETNFVQDSENFELKVFEIMGFVCILNYIEKQEGKGFVRDSGRRDVQNIEILQKLFGLKPF